MAVLLKSLDGGRVRFGGNTKQIKDVDRIEQMNATSGIGYMINLARTYAQTDVIVVGLVVYALLGLSSDLAVRALESRALAWRRTLGK